MGKCHDFCDCNDCSGKKHKDVKEKSCDFVKDKICCEWCIPHGQSQDVYVAAGVNVFASGFISVNCDEGLDVTVHFYKGSTPVAGPFTISGGSCMTFTAANFNRIEVSCPGYGGNGCSGKICMTPRYQVHCDSHGNNHEDCECE